MVLPTDKHIVVVLSEQKLYAIKDGLVVYTFNCCTGKSSTPTPAGNWSVRGKMRVGKALEEYGGTPLPWMVQLDIVKNGRRERIGIHSYPYVPRKPASHGCIRLKYSDAQRIFGYAEVGQAVSILKSKPDYLIDAMNMTAALKAQKNGQKPPAPIPSNAQPNPQPKPKAPEKVLTPAEQDRKAFEDAMKELQKPIKPKTGT